MALTGENIIGYSRGAKGTKFRTENPATGELIPNEFFTATTSEVDEAMEKAASAFAIYKNIGGKERAAFLRDIADELTASAETLTPMAMAESGLPEARIKGETGRTCGQLRLFADLVEEGSYVDARIETAQPDRTPVPKPDLRSMQIPLGPVVVFGASNFPLAFSTVGGDTASALAAGCPVVVKGHPAHPGTSEIMAQAVIKAARNNNLPDGVFSLLFDSGIEVGVQLAKHDNAKAIAFTGSLKGGRALMDIAAARKNPIPVYAEMGSVNPTVLLPGILSEKSDKIAAGLSASVTMGVGQFCTNPGLVLGIKDEGWDRFCSELKNQLANVAQGTMLTDGICTNYHSDLDEVCKREEIDVLLKTDSVEQGKAGASLIRIKSSALRVTPELANEIFGPVSLLVECDSKDDLRETLSCLEGQLTASIHGNDNDLNENGDLITQLTALAGRVIYNAFPTGVDVSAAMVHGGPYPASSDGRSTSVGMQAILRFMRPVAFQGFPENTLPTALQSFNPLNIWQTVDGERLKKS